MATQTLHVEDALALQAKAGDHHAQRYLLRQAGTMLRGMLRQKNYFLPLKGSKEDLIQIGLIAWAQAIETWEPEKGTFVGWAWFCAERAIITEIKTANRQKRSAQNEALSLQKPVKRRRSHKASDLTWGDTLPDTKPNSDPANMVRHYSRLIDLLCANLSDHQRRCVQLAILEGRPWPEVQRMLCITHKSLDNALQLAKGKMRQKALALIWEPGALDEADRYTLQRLMKASRGEARGKPGRRPSPDSPRRKQAG